MEIILGEPPQFRSVPMDITNLVLAALKSSGVEVPAIEIDESDDNIFLSVRSNGELYHNNYLQIRLDDDYYSDASVYFVEVKERQHSGGDISIKDCFEFFPADLEKYVSQIHDVFIQYKQT